MSDMKKTKAELVKELELMRQQFRTYDQLRREAEAREEMTVFSTRVHKTTKEDIRAASFELKTSIQNITEEALQSWLHETEQRTGWVRPTQRPGHPAFFDYSPDEQSDTHG